MQNKNQEKKKARLYTMLQYSASNRSVFKHRILNELAVSDTLLYSICNIKNAAYDYVNEMRNTADSLGSAPFLFVRLMLIHLCVLY